MTERLLQEGAERRDPVLPQGDARRHGMAAALDQKPLGYRLPHGASDIDAGHGAAGPGADAIHVKRNGECQRQRRRDHEPRSHLEKLRVVLAVKRNAMQ